MITKNQIKLIKSLRSKKNRIQSGFFVAEGEKIVDELIESDLNSINIFSTSEKYKNLKNHISINSTQLKQISNQKSPNNVVGIFKIPKNSEIDFNSNIIALEEINDPGNLGTIIRLCDWFGIKDIICSTNSVDCYNPKVIQASMGSISRVNISYMDLNQLLTIKNYNTVAADLKGEKLTNYKFTANHIIFFGSESNGFSKKLSSKINDKITIKRYNNNVESLNLATSVAIILSELKAQITGK
jgi:TrmH family RNA methyltransferase